MEWTTSSQDATLLEQAGYAVFEFKQFRSQFIAPVDRIGAARNSLENAAGPVLRLFAEHAAVAVLNVPVGNYWDLRALYGYVVEPAYRNDCRLLVQATRELDRLKPEKFVEPEFGYAWSLERLRHLSARYRRRSVDASRPPMTPIEEMLLEAMSAVGLAPRPQYGIGRYRADFAFPERLLTVEADGRGYHDAIRDHRRDESLRGEGWDVIRFKGSQIFRDAAGCAEEIAKVYRSRREAPEYTDAPHVEPRRRWWTWIVELIQCLKWFFAPDPQPDEGEARVVLDLEDLPAGMWCDGLDVSQRDAVLSHEGVVQVIAPAGSGKTRVLVSRVRELVSRGVPEERVLCTTFNKATEKELKARLSEVGVGGASVRTFHSVGHFILKEEEKLRGSTGSLSYSQWRRLSSTAKGEDDERVWLDAPDAAEAVSNFKLGEMISPAEAWERAHTATEKTAARIYALYEEELERLDRNDFDDLILNAVRLLREDARVRVKWQDKWECVLVDEYQDIEPAQELLIQLIAAPEDCLMVVGDEDQCIYTWRRAEVERIINLDKRYPGLKRAVLTTCYRCPADVVSTASRLIQNNKRRFPKVIEAGRGAQSASSFERPVASGKGGGHAVQVATELKSCDPTQTVVLARTSRLLRDVALACATAGVPVKASDRVLRPAESERVVLAYMRLLSSPIAATADDVIEVFRVPNRYLPDSRGHNVAERLRAGGSFRDAIDGVSVEPWRVRKMAEGAEFFDRAKTAKDAAELLHLLRTEGGLDKHYSDKERMSAHDQIEIEVLDALGSEFASSSLAGAVKAMQTRADALAKASDDDGVELSTIHGAKGREWSRVILYGWDQDQLPHQRGLEEASSPEEREKFTEDERRLAYVAMTRSTGSIEVVVVKSPESQFSVEAGLSSRVEVGRIAAPTPSSTPKAVERGTSYSSRAGGPTDRARSHRLDEPAPRAAEHRAKYSSGQSGQSAKPRRTGPRIQSKYDNTCAVCSRSVKVGDLICPVVYHGETKWVHARCAEG